MSSSFEKVAILDNYYQTSSFYPMPVVMVSTLSENGTTNLGSYSLCFPYLIAGRHAMMLVSRDGSNTSVNLRREKVCALNFIPFDKKLLANSVMLGYPGETTDEKMKNSRFTLVPSERADGERETGRRYPDIVRESVQVFECTWDESFPEKFRPEDAECHFVLRIDRIAMKAKWKKALFSGQGFPSLPVDYGYRNNRGFWFARHARPHEVRIPASKGQSVDSIVYATQRFDPDVAWERDACAKIVKVPRVFLNTVIKSCVEAAKKEGVTTITPEFMDRIRNKRAGER